MPAQESLRSRPGVTQFPPRSHSGPAQGVKPLGPAKGHVVLPKTQGFQPSLTIL
jgi:hypothetical protein